MAYPLVFLIGLHGTGKSTIGRLLAQNHGYHHISLGDLGRLLRRRQIPRGYSLRFLRILAAHEIGQRMAPELIEALHSEIASFNQTRPLVVDGFPAEPYHVAGLPADSTVIHLTCHDDVRMQRLIERGEKTVRRWTQGETSRRDQQLGMVVDAAMKCSDIRTFSVSSENEPNAIADHIAGHAQRATSGETIFQYL